MNELFDTLSTNVNDIFIMLDIKERNVSYISPNVEQIIGLSVEDVRKKIYHMIEHGQKNNSNDCFVHLHDISHGEKQEWEQEIVNKNTGEPRWFNILAYRTEIVGIERYVIILSDMTNEKNLNQALFNALEMAKSANEAKSSFLANMSHDIRTPMNAIVGFASLLERDADDPDKVRDYTGKIMSSSRHLLGIINDILDMSKIESGHVALNIHEFSLVQLLDEVRTVIQPLAKSRNQKFDLFIKGDIPDKLLGDKTRLNQILLNLLSNSVKYTPDGGAFSLTLEVPEQKIRNYIHLRFIVADNGQGMSSGFLKNIFEPFSRENTEIVSEIQGTGLGLAITKNIVNLMGGTVSVKSTPGRGSIFRVELQLQIAEDSMEKQEDKDNVKTDVSILGLHVLAAEDNELNAEILQELLNMQGITSELVCNGLEAVGRFEQSEPGEFDLIIMDIQMPVMDGYEAARRIRAGNHVNAKDIPIIAMTANAFDDDVKKAFEAGMDMHTSKPINIDNLKKVIRQLLA